MSDITWSDIAKEMDKYRSDIGIILTDDEKKFVVLCKMETNEKRCLSWEKTAVLFKDKFKRRIGRTKLSEVYKEMPEEEREKYLKELEKELS